MFEAVTINEQMREHEKETDMQDKAREALQYFTQKTRDNGETFITRTVGAPGWVSDMIYAAHDNGDMLPDDWRYQFINDALLVIEEDGDPDEIESDIYTADLFEWLGSHSYRQGYCDDAMGGLDFKHLGDVVAYAQRQEKIEVYYQVYNFLEGMNG